MANNRMFLVHRPTGLALMLGKHMGWGWYRPPTAPDMQKLFDAVAEQCHSLAAMEDFCLWMESCEADTPFVVQDSPEEVNYVAIDEKLPPPLRRIMLGDGVRERGTR